MPNTYGAGADGNLPADMGEVEIPDVQVTIRSSQNMLQFRELTVSVHTMLSSRASKFDSSHLDFFTPQADTLTKLVRLPGIVINASQLSSRASTLSLQCKGCRSTRVIAQPGGGVGQDRSLPRKCDA